MGGESGRMAKVEVWLETALDFVSHSLRSLQLSSILVSLAWIDFYCLFIGISQQGVQADPATSPVCRHRNSLHFSLYNNVSSRYVGHGTGSNAAHGSPMMIPNPAIAHSRASKEPRYGVVLTRMGVTAVAAVRALPIETMGAKSSRKRAPSGHPFSHVHTISGIKPPCCLPQG